MRDSGLVASPSVCLPSRCGNGEPQVDVRRVCGDDRDADAGIDVTPVPVPRGAPLDLGWGGSLYDRLTQLDAWQEPGAKTMKYVVPNDPANGYLYNEIAKGTVGEASPGVASVNMPPNAPLSATDIAMVKKWIESGAPK